MKVSLFSDIKKTKGGVELAIDKILADIRDGKYQDISLKIANEQDKKVRTELKKKVPYFTASGTFETRNNNGLLEASGLIAIDFDDLTNISDTEKLLRADRYTFALFRSISQKGLCALVRIDPTKHLESFLSLENYYWQLLQLPIDQSCKDISRPRYVSFDPHLYHNPSSEIFTKLLPKKKTDAPKRETYTHTKNRFERIMSELDRDITGDYLQWRNIGFAIASEYGENGLHYFHHISSFHQNYDPAQTDRVYKFFNRQFNGGISIATFYYYAKLEGVAITNPHEQKIEQVTYLAKESGKNKTEIVELIDKEFGKDAIDTELIDKVLDSNTELPTSDPKKLDIAAVELWLKTAYNIRRNLITRFYECDGRELETEDLNTIYIKGKKIFPKLSRDIFDTILFSNFTPTCDPIREFFDSLKWDGVDRLTDLCRSITSNTGDFEFRYKMLSKWLVGIVESVYTENPNILCLVLAGQKNTGKTVFFKKLLPKELKYYFALSQLDKGKDDEILMCQKLIIFDDEYSGKSKQDSKKMKMLLSTDYFTLREPYGRKNVTLRRLATLCGTCNEIEILNDPTGNRRIIVFEASGRFDYDLYNSIDKTQLFAQIKDMQFSGQSSTLSTAEIDQLEAVTGKEYSEINIEQELCFEFYEPSTSRLDFKTATMIKVEIEDKTGQRINIKKLGMALRESGFERTAKNGMYGYLIKPKIYNTENIEQEILPF